MTAPENVGFPAFDFYTHYYDALPRSRAYSEFCRQLYGMDLGQHGFSDMEQIDALLDAMQITAGEHALDLGCGDGRIAEYISDRTGACVTGLDLIPTAIEHALARTECKRDRLRFVTGSMSALDRLFGPASFEVLIAIDSLYFTDLPDTIGQMKRILRPRGRIGIFYALGADPWHPAGTFPKETLHPDRGPLARALRGHGFQYRHWDFTQADYEHARRKKAIIEALRPTYATEEDRSLCECRAGEADGVMAACEAGVHARHLFLAWL